MKLLSGKIEQDIKTLDKALRVSDNFDIHVKEAVIAGRKAKLYFVNSFTKDEVLEMLLVRLSVLKKREINSCVNAKNFSEKFVSYGECSQEKDVDMICLSVLSGTTAMIIDDFKEAIIIDCRSYPSKSIEEPDSDRVLRGSHDGFCETLTVNAALIRRRFRDTDLIIKNMKAGKKSKTDLFVCYLEDKVDKKSLQVLLKKIEAIDVNTLSMSQQSLAECLLPKQWYNPFPKIRYTERPDTVTATVSEGNIVVMIDNSPCAMIIETSFFDFIQNSNDYYFPPIIGSYLRYVRMIVFLLTMITTPLWYLFVVNPQWIPQWLDFIRIEQPVSLPVIFQLLLVELVIDALKLASLNTPNSLNASFSVIGALVLGQFAVDAKWFVSEVVLYMAFVAVANYSQPSFELGYAFKFSRLFLLVMTAIFNIYGFVLALVIICVVISTTKTVTGKSYLYPLYPFDWKALKSLLIRGNIQNSKGQNEERKKS